MGSCERGTRITARQANFKFIVVGRVHVLHSTADLGRGEGPGEGGEKKGELA